MIIGNSEIYWKCSECKKIVKDNHNCLKDQYEQENAIEIFKNKFPDKFKKLEKKQHNLEG
jgi:peptidoglycan hydrolase CwlO-like protein